MKWVAIFGVLVVLSGGGSEVRNLLESLGGEVPSMNQTSQEDGCRLRSKPVTVWLSQQKYPYTIAHIRAAWRDGQPRVLHLDRAGAKENRDESLQGIPTRTGYDRDEWPMAASREGGEGAHIAYVPSSDNRGAGSSVGNQLDGWCSGQAFRVRFSD